jgi:hypothetical protein
MMIPKETVIMPENGKNARQYDGRLFANTTSF